MLSKRREIKKQNNPTCGFKIKIPTQFMIFFKKHSEFIAVTFLLSFFLLIGITSLIQKSPIFDEPIHLTGGYVALHDNDFRINPENGILPQTWVALPLIFLINEIYPPDKTDNFWNKRLNWNISSKFLFKSANNHEKMLLIARIMIMIIATVGALAIYIASKQIWGKAGAFVSLGLFILSPTIMANSRFVTSDLFCAIFFFLAVWTFQMLLTKFTLSRLIMMSISIACLFLSKMSAPIIIPITLIMISLRLYRKKAWPLKLYKSYFTIKSQWKQALCFIGILSIAGIITISSIWGIFGFRYSMLSDDKGSELLKKQWIEILKEDKIPQKTIVFIKKNRLIPEGYIYGLAHVIHESKLRYSFMNGKYSSAGLWYFFPISFLIKTPIPILIFFILGLVALFIQKSKSRILIRLNKSAFLLVLPSVYFIFSLATNINIGHRHLLPIYPPLFVLAGGAIYLFRNNSFKKWGISLLFTILLFENIFLYPNYLTYFSPLVGGSSQGYKYMVDSSLDWGQELKGLKKWLQNNNIPDNNVYLSYFGSTNLKAYGLPQKQLLCCFEQNPTDIFKLKEGTYCISATMLQMVYRPEMATWNAELEKMLTGEYRSAFQNLYRMLIKKEETSRIKDLGITIKKFRIYEMLRFAKLAYHLRNREPNAMIGNSILIFNLKNKDLKEILGNELGETNLK